MKSFAWENGRRKSLSQCGCIVLNPRWSDSTDHRATRELMQFVILLSQPWEQIEIWKPENVLCKLDKEVKKLLC